MATEHEEKLGTEDSKWLGEYSQVHMNVFGTPLRVMDHGQGAHIWDVDGNEYLDFLAGIAVNSLRIRPPQVGQGGCRSGCQGGAYQQLFRVRAAN